MTTDSTRSVTLGLTKTIIQRSLKPIIGLPLSDAGRASSLEWFEFGEYVLDTENAWHIASPREGIVVASQDRLYPAGDDPYRDLMDFDWDRPGVNRCDERMKRFLEQHKARPVLVKAINAKAWGGLEITLTQRYLLEIFSNTSLDREYWRLFKRSSTNKHFVVTAHGLER